MSITAETSALRSQRTTPRFSLTDKQKSVRNILSGPSPHCLVFGGSRSGKTFLLCYAIATRAIMAPGSRHLIARFTRDSVMKSIWADTWPKMMSLAYPGMPAKLNKSDGFVTLANKSEIWFGGLDDKERVEKVLGSEYATIYCNECSQISYETILMLRSRLAQAVERTDESRLPLKFYYDLNPTGRAHWTYREFVEGVRPESQGIAIEPGSRAHAVMNPIENPHLPTEYIKELEALPEKQRKRFYDGSYMLTVPGALWSFERISELRVSVEQPLKRIVVAIDPAVTSGDDADESGIIVLGQGFDGHAYVLRDASLKGSPDDICRRAVELCRQYGADRIVAEANNGGDWIESLLRTADPTVPYKKILAKSGKVTRAEPESSLYEQGLVHHVGHFATLEDQMCAFTGDFDRKAAGYSPDRVDALVWGLKELYGKTGWSFA